MATPAEFLYESCTCTGGMRDGARCADCSGRGIVSRGTTPTGLSIPAEADDTEDDGLDQLSVTDLRAKAKELDLPAGGTKAALVGRIRQALDDEGDADDHDSDAGDESDDDSDGGDS